jgi:ribonuclease G
MSTELIINASLPETRIALMENGEIQDLVVERASGKGIVGNIYKGRVTRVLPGMQAAFVDIGLEKAAFLYVDDVYVHSEIWEDEEEEKKTATARILEEVEGSSSESQNAAGTGQAGEAEPTEAGAHTGHPDEASHSATHSEHTASAADEASAVSGAESEAREHLNDSENEMDLQDEGDSEHEEDLDSDPLGEDDEDSDDDHGPEEMGTDPSDSGDGSDDSHGNRVPEGTIKPQFSEPREESGNGEGESSASGTSEGQDAGQPKAAGGEGNAEGEGAGGQKGRRHRRGRRGGKFRNKRERGPNRGEAAPGTVISPVSAQQGPVSADFGGNFNEHVSEDGNMDSDRSAMEGGTGSSTSDVDLSRPPIAGEARRLPTPVAPGSKSGLQETRSRDRRVRAKASLKPERGQVNIQDLLKEGQEVLVQVAKDPIATKGARLTCHISLPGRHLVCMPTIDHVGVSRRIDRDEERRRLRDFVEKNRPRGLGFIVRTASGKQQSEKRIKQDIDYLARLWDEIREKSAQVSAPALVYEDLNSILRAIRDWVTEEIDKIVVDSRYHYNDILRFVSHFMPSLKQKVELYHGDVPIFDAYGISTELSRSLERKVWLKSGGYLVIDQAEALVAIDVNTGRYVGKKNLEDTILKTNLEAVQEIAYQLRLRNCGGIIILDLIDMEKEENKQRVYRALEEALKRDRARPTILKISELGLVEMTRKRTRDTIIRTLCESCSHCEGKGFIKSKQTVAYEVMREVEREGIERDMSKILVQAHPDVIDILAIDERETLDQLERRYRKQVYLQAVGDFHPEQFEVAGDKKASGEAGRESENSAENRSGRNRESRHGRGGGRDRDRGRNRDQKDRGGSTKVIRPHNGANPEGATADGSLPPEPMPTGKVIINPSPTAAILPVGQGAGNPGGESSADGTGNSMAAPRILPAALGAGAPPRTAGDDGFYDEEDRLAFLRAQAAQDAALARLGAQSPGAASRTFTPRNAPAADNGGGPGGAGGRRGRRGRRGGRNNKQKNDRGPNRGFQPRGPINGAAGPSEGGGPTIISPVQAREPRDEAPKSSEGNGNGGSGSGHSTPPVV